MSNKRLIKMKRKISGRDSAGHVSIRHRGGGHKRKLRVIDWKGDKYGIPAVVKSIEYDPNRSAKVAFLQYEDGEKRYIIAPANLAVNDKIVSGVQAEARVGNRLPLKKIPLGIAIHNVELSPKKGGQLVRSAGASATILSREGEFATVRFPSGTLRKISLSCWATIGQVGNVEFKNRVLGKAGRNRHLGIRPTVRGVAMNPRSHPHGGGEGRSPIGMPSPKTPWGKKARGVKTRKVHKWSDKYIVNLQGR